MLDFGVGRCLPTSSEAGGRIKRRCVLGLDTLVYELILRVAQPGEGAWIEV